MTIEKKDIPNTLNEQVRRLLKKAGLEFSFNLTPLATGRNNRVFKVDLGEEKYLLKVYFQNDTDLRNRLENEFSFVSFAWDQGICAVPKPIAFDRENSLGLYEFINGKKLVPGSITKDFVHQALQFYDGLNQKKNEPAAQNLVNASEACFNIADHLNCVDFRIQRLKNIQVYDEVSAQAHDFIKRHICVKWEMVKDLIRQKVDQLSLPWRQNIVSEDRCLSPSDFGFHNAILEKNNTLRFIDFEYAGWDDPAKLVCDFFCQPEVPLPLTYFKTVAEFIAKQSPDPSDLRLRINLLFQVYHLKWCAIILNDFLPVGNARRQFASQKNVKDRKVKQLKKVRSYFTNCPENLSIMGEAHGIY